MLFPDFFQDNFDPIFSNNSKIFMSRIRGTGTQTFMYRFRFPDCKKNHDDRQTMTEILFFGFLGKRRIF